jgi:hypothetical protein
MPVLMSVLALLLAWRQRRQRLATQKAGGLIVDMADKASEENAQEKGAA